MNTLQRRHALLLIMASPIAASGCSRQEIAEATSDVPTEVLTNTRIGLRGFQIVAFTVGQRMVVLPLPAVRILGVALLVSGVATFLVVEYLDVELKRRIVREELSDKERIAIESNLAVEFQTDNGLTESVALGPNRYEEVDQTPDNG